MKFRAGFVSNSSTSTFLVRADALVQTVFDLAEIMMPVRGGGSGYKSDERRLKKMRADKMDPDTPLAFQSCNYGTYILPLEVDGKKVFAVSTCNNVPWCDCDTLHTLYSGAGASQAVFKMFGLPVGEWGALHSAIKRGRDFAWVASGVVGHPPDRSPPESCPKHPYSALWQSGRKLVCRTCGDEVERKSP